MKRSKGLGKEEHYKLKKMGLDKIQAKDFHKKKEITKVRARVFIIFLFPLSSLDKRQTECWTEAKNKAENKADAK